MNRKPEVPVSVVIPCYRCAATIGRAVESVLEQSVIPAEIILVEDCSGDKTLEALQNLTRTYPARLKVLQLKRNQGAASARNAGWLIATQQYVAFLDADDSWHPEKLSVQYNYMLSDPEIALCGHQCVCLRNGETAPMLPKTFHVTKISASSLLLRSAFSTPTVMLKRDVPFRFQEGIRYLEDLLLWQQIAFSGLKVARIESPLAYVHKPFYGAGGLSAQLWNMEKGELDNFVVLYKAGSINLPQYSAATIFSIIKFFKRLVVTGLRKAR